MARIRGHYEWDDDDLTPGRKKEGGLHQNVYDSDGNLKSNARFVPDDQTDPEPVELRRTEHWTLLAPRHEAPMDELNFIEMEAVECLRCRAEDLHPVYRCAWGHPRSEILIGLAGKACCRGPSRSQAVTRRGWPRGGGVTPSRGRIALACRLR